MLVSAFDGASVAPHDTTAGQVLSRRLRRYFRTVVDDPMVWHVVLPAASYWYASFFPTLVPVLVTDSSWRAGVYV